MTEIILTLIIVFLCIVGLTEIIHNLKSRLYSTNSLPKSEITVYIDGENADLQLLCFLRNAENIKNTRIRAFFIGENDEKREICRRIAEKYNIDFK